MKVDSFLLLKDFFNIPKILFALFAIELICWSKLRSGSIMIPKSRSAVVSDNVCVV